MSTLRTDTLQNVAGSLSVPVATVVQGSAKAWVSFNGTGTVAIQAAFNVGSITDNAVGDYTVNFTSAITDANYAVVVTCGNSAGTLSTAYPCFTKTASAVRIRTVAVGPNSTTDFEWDSVAVFR